MVIYILHHTPTCAYLQVYPMLRRISAHIPPITFNYQKLLRGDADEVSPLCCAVLYSAASGTAATAIQL